MQLVLEVWLPLLVVFVMTLVGLDLQPADFLRLRSYPRAVAVAAAAQLAVPLVVAIALAMALGLPAQISGGLLIVAAAPIAALSNFYSLLARADLALAVALTALSSAAAVVLMPLSVTLGFRLLALDAAGVELPVARLLQQTVLSVLVPIVLGMALRALLTAWVERQRARLQVFALLALLTILAVIAVNQFGTIVAQLGVLVPTALLFTVATLGAGWAIALRAAPDAPQRRALLFGFPARNMSIAALLAVAVFRRPEMAGFAVVFFILQAAALIPLALLLGAHERAMRK
jgi:BASS family bile acid:Na+ symporter